MKKGLQKALTLLLIFVVAAAAVFYITRGDDEEEIIYDGMSDASLPVVHSLYGGEEINRLYGYTESMKEEYMRENMTPLGEDGQMTITVDCYENRLLSLKYEVRDADSGRLIESTQVDDWTEQTRQGQDEGTLVTAKLPIQKLIEEGKEYLLKISLTTDHHDQIHYYTRIVYNSQFHAQEMIDFVNYFSARTFDPEEKQEGLSELGTYIEPDRTGDNSSLAYVNIHSNHRMLTWMNLEPERITEPLVEIRQLNGTIGTLRLTYQVRATGDTGLRETYDVEENFVIRWSQLRFYLLAYERTMNQHFEGDTNTIEGGIVDLGIVEDDATQLKTSASGEYTVFTAGGELWSYNGKVNEAVKIFSFRNGTREDVRTDHNDHDFQIIQVEDTGDVSFMIYGYMNSGSHEGQVAMVFYRYNSEERALQEIFYIPAYTSYGLLRQEMGTLSYISSTGLIYVMVGNTIYAIDVDGTEHVVVVDDLQEGTFVISEDSSVIAWQEGDDPYSCTALSVMYLSDGKKNTIQASLGEYLKPLGFIGSDFIYGIAESTDITSDISGKTSFPMYAMEIVDREGNILTTYREPDAYVLGVEVDGGRIQVNCTVLDYKRQPMEFYEDVLLRNEEDTSMAPSVLTTGTSDRKKKVHSINLSKWATEGKTLTIHTPVRLLSPTANRVELASDISRENDPRYFAYSYGELAAISYNVSDAIQAAYDNMGVVVDAGQNLVWARGSQKSETRISINSACVTSREDMTLIPCIQALLFQEGVTIDVGQMLDNGMSVREILQEALPDKALDLSGATLQQVLYFISEGNPVIVLTGETTADLMVGYDNINITFFDVLDGTYYKMGRNDTMEYLEKMGGYLFSCR